MEEESFQARVVKVFGSLPHPDQPHNIIINNNDSNKALWSLTDDQVHKREWNRHKYDTSHDDDLSGPFAVRPLSKRKHKRLLWAGSRGLIKNRLKEWESEENGLDDDDEEDEEEEDEEAGPSSRIFSKPDNCNDDEWIIRSSIGRDCTLDKEEEEDEFDKLAVGREKPADRIYMNEIIDYTTYADTFYELPTSVEHVSRDPRANHLAAELRIKEDAQVICELNGKETVVVHSSNTQIGLPLSVDRVNLRPILKNDAKKAESKSVKRVRFDPEIACNLKKKHVSESGKEKRDLLQSPQSDSRVPDYLRNPSKYTQYTFDSSNDLDDEAANRKSFLDFFNLVRQQRANELQIAERVDESPNMVTFVPRKRINSGHVEQGDAAKRSSGHKKNFLSRGGCPVIAAADEWCAMEEDAPETETTPVSSTIAGKGQRQYRARAISEQLDEGL